MISLRNVRRATATTTASALLLAALTLAAAPDLQAQARPDSTRAAGAAQPTRQPPMEAQQEQLAAMAPMMGQMMQVMLQSTLRALAMPESAEQLATFTRNYYDALVAKGFTRDEALRIVMAHGIPATPTGR